MNKFRLSHEEGYFLKKLASSDKSVSDLVRFPESSIKSPLTVEVSRPNVERLRERLTELLANAGFQDDYSLSGRGEMLERLIDVFYLR